MQTIYYKITGGISLHEDEKTLKLFTMDGCV